LQAAGIEQPERGRNRTLPPGRPAQTRRRGRRRSQWGQCPRLVEIQGKSPRTRLASWTRLMPRLRGEVHRELLFAGERDDVGVGVFQIAEEFVDDSSANGLPHTSPG